jgi:hypothetical protein
MLLTSLVAQAAVKLNYEVKKAGDPGTPGTATVVVDAGHIRSDGMVGAGRGLRASHTVIMDAAGYREITEADAQQTKERMNSMKAQISEQMKSMPPDQRKRMEETMAHMGDEGAEVKYTPLGAKKKISGFACEMYKMELPLGPNIDICIAPWSSSVVTKAEMAFFKKVASQVDSTFPGSACRLMAAWGKAPGVMVETTHLGPDGKLEATVTWKSITRGAVPASEFQVPPAYTKASNPMMAGGQRGPGGSPVATP